MCGRFAFYSPAEATAALFDANAVPDFRPRYNIAPTQDIAAIRTADNGERELSAFRWGLVPFWAKDIAIGNRMINARAETVAEKPSFRAAYKRRRCLILADGFYEWHRTGDVKTPYFISPASGEPFAFAGLWEHWEDKQSGEIVQSAAIITTEANPFMQTLHHRMPIVLGPATADRWMDGDNTLLDAVTADSPRMRAWPVDRRVNNARNEGSDLTEPVGEVMEG